MCSHAELHCPIDQETSADLTPEDDVTQKSGHNLNVVVVPVAVTANDGLACHHYRVVVVVDVV